MSSHNGIQVVGIGEILWDLLPEGRQIGGATTNFAFHTNAKGISATVASAVGDDALGREIREQVATWNMNPRYIQVRPEYPTGVVDVRVDAHGVPEYTIQENVAWDHIAWNADLEALAQSVRAVCFGSLGQRADESRATIQKFLASVQPSCIRICDINLRQTYFSDDVLRDSLRIANVVKLNHEELPVVARCLDISGTPMEMLKGLRDHLELDLIALTRGGKGSVLLSATELSDHPGYPVEVVDTVGAGDAFTASLVVGLLRATDLDTINVSANRTAAEVCLHAGAIPGMMSDSAKIKSASSKGGTD